MSEIGQFFPPSWYNNVVEVRKMTDTPRENLPLAQAACYAAMGAHDARFDGRFFCAVSSTMIYCRPVCRVKQPKAENCTFFPSAAAAEAAGYRPCLRCRPELAPGLAPVDAVTRLARSAARLMEEDGLSDRSLSELASMLGISDRHLRRVFFAEFGVAPVQYLQTRRLLLAKSLLADTSLSVTDVAMSSGFGSIRRFNHLFRQRYRLAPSRLRKKAQDGEKDRDSISLFLAYRPPYAWDEILSFLQARAVPGVEWVAQGIYRRSVAIRKGDTLYRGWIAVSHTPKLRAVSVTVASELLPVLPQVLARVRHLFDIDCDPEAVLEKLATLKAISPDLPVPGIRVPGAFDPFESCIRAVLGQQVTVKAARTIAARLAAAFGEKVATPFKEVNCTFPLAETILALEAPVEDRLGPIGITGARTRTILALARALASGEVTFISPANPEAEMAKLLKFPGLGQWTVQYIAMRVMAWPDAFPATDYGVKKALAALPTGEAMKLAEEWSPWRSYATVSLWHILSETAVAPAPA
jgi:AraC family transcriptional regulator, regulatory protein of adaptative response / DNA-3-methyladenine glycosylase II